MKNRFSHMIDDELFELLKANVPSTDRAKILVGKQLTTDSLMKLVNREICAVHVKNYFSKSLAKRGDRNILAQTKLTRWSLGTTKQLTDVNFGIGYPREQAALSTKGIARYKKMALPSLREVRSMFAPELSPFDQLRLDLSEVWPHGASIDPFKGDPGFAGIVRVITASTLFEGNAGKNGVCHVDCAPDRKAFSANLYLNIPPTGGELRIWNLQLDKKLMKNPVYSFLNGSAFTPIVRDIIQEFLPPPLIIKPKPGDLVIIDVARPHAAGGGFKKGHRTNIQCFIQLEANTDKPALLLRS